MFTLIRRSCAGRNLKRYVQRFLLSQERRVKALVFNDLFRVSLKDLGLTVRPSIFVFPVHPGLAEGLTTNRISGAYVELPELPDSRRLELTN